MISWQYCTTISEKEKREVNRQPVSFALMFSSGVLGLEFSLQSLFKEEVVFTIVRDGSSLVDLAFESSHCAV